MVSVGNRWMIFLLPLVFLVGAVVSASEEVKPQEDEEIAIKRAWKDIKQNWGKRAWSSIQGNWGKRGWDRLNGPSWGSRLGSLDNEPRDLEELFEGIEKRPEWAKMRGTWGKRKDGEWKNMMKGTWGKRGWVKAKNSWGKRSDLDDELAGDFN